MIGPLVTAAVALACIGDKIAVAQIACDAEVLTPGDVQGVTHPSPLTGEDVTVEGLVTRFDDDNVWIQTVASAQDADDRTSEGLLIFSRDVDFTTVPGIAAGVLLRARGSVLEFRFSSSDGLRTTEVVVSDTMNITVCDATPGSSPEPVVVYARRGRVPPGEFIYDAPAGGIDVEECGASCPELLPTVNGMDFWESLESNLLRIRGADVVRADRSGNFYVVPDKGRVDPSSLNRRGGVTIDAAANDFNPEVIKVLTSSSPEPFDQPEIGDRITGHGLVGVLGINFDVFTLFLTETPQVIRRPESRKFERRTDLPTPANGEVSVMTYNILNCPGDDTDRDAERLETIAGEIAVKLKAPYIVALQELQRIIDAIISAGGPTYTFSEIAPLDDQDGGIPGGNIRVAFLYRADKVSLAPSAEGRKGGPTEAVAVVGEGADIQLSVNPGRVDPNNPAYEGSRKTLVAHFIDAASGASIFVVNVHFSSKRGSDQLMGPVQPPANGGVEDRIGQAAAVNAFVRAVLCEDEGARVAVVGDFNEFDAFEPLQVLQEGGILADLLTKLPQTDRYTFNFEGNSQALDHVYVTPALFADSEADILHVNPGVIDQASDHDPILALLVPSSETAGPNLHCTIPPPTPTPAN